MGHFTRRSITALLAVLTLAPAAPAVASAGLLPPPVRVAGRQPVRTEAAPVGDLTAAGPSRGFDWADAGIGAAGALVLVGVAGAAVSTTRRAGSSRQPSLHRS
jgi:hypothetical protein